MMPAPVEAVVVYAVVAFCATYCIWLFMPAGMKRWAATALLKRFPRLGASTALEALTQKSAACSSGCNSCGSHAGTSQPPAREHKVHWTKRPR